jgi:hypothetical protein
LNSSVEPTSIPKKTVSSRPTPKQFSLNSTNDYSNTSSTNKLSNLIAPNSTNTTSPLYPTLNSYNSNSSISKSDASSSVPSNSTFPSLYNYSSAISSEASSKNSQNQTQLVLPIQQFGSFSISQFPGPSFQKPTTSDSSSKISVNAISNGNFYNSDYQNKTSGFYDGPPRKIGLSFHVS